MKRASPATRELAKRLIALEGAGRKSSVARPSAMFHVCEKLRPALATLLGGAGYHALVSRALVLAKAEVPWLGAVHVNADGSLKKLTEPDRQLDAQDIEEGRVVLLAQLLGLLVAFIGEALTMQLTREVWPNLSIDDRGMQRKPR